MTNLGFPSNEKKGMDIRGFSLDSGYLPKVSQEKERPILTFFCFLFACFAITTLVVALSV